jgi:hypothetical protein
MSDKIIYSVYIVINYVGRLLPSFPVYFLCETSFCYISVSLNSQKFSVYSFDSETFSFVVTIVTE